MTLSVSGVYFWAVWGKTSESSGAQPVMWLPLIKPLSSSHQSLFFLSRNRNNPSRRYKVMHAHTQTDGQMFGTAHWLAHAWCLIAGLWNLREPSAFQTEAKQIWWTAGCDPAVIVEMIRLAPTVRTCRYSFSRNRSESSKIVTKLLARACFCSTFQLSRASFSYNDLIWRDENLARSRSFASSKRTANALFEVGWACDPACRKRNAEKAIPLFRYMCEKPRYAIVRTILCYILEKM